MRNERDLKELNVGLQISIRQSGVVTILDLRGRAIGGGESELLDSHLQKLVANGVRKFLLNLTDLTQVDSSVISVIARTYLSVRGQGGSLKFLSPQGRVLEVLKTLHMLDIIPSLEDETQALASFQPQSYAA
jgi:anti-anti-sigma factor